MSSSIFDAINFKFSSRSWMDQVYRVVEEKHFELIYIWIFISEFLWIKTWYLIKDFLKLLFVFLFWTRWCQVGLNSTFEHENVNCFFLYIYEVNGEKFVVELDEIVTNKKHA
jgi:hypothetical protein